MGGGKTGGKRNKQAPPSTYSSNGEIAAQQQAEQRTAEQKQQVEQKITQKQQEVEQQTS